MQPKIRIDSKEFTKQSGISSVTQWRKSKSDPTFPTPVYILNKKLWYQDEVTAWIEANEQQEPTHNNLIPKTKPKLDRKSLKDDSVRDAQEAANQYCAEQAV